MSSLTGRRLCLLAGSNEYSKERPNLVACFLFCVNSLIELYNKTCSFSSLISAVGHLLISFQKAAGPRKCFASATVCRHAQAKKNKCLHYYQRGGGINLFKEGTGWEGRVGEATKTSGLLQPWKVLQLAQTGQSGWKFKKTQKGFDKAAMPNRWGNTVLLFCNGHSGAERTECSLAKRIPDN